MDSAWPPDCYAIIKPAEDLERAARDNDGPEIERQFALVAKAIEARRAATTGAVEDESAVPKGFAQTGDDA